MRRPSRAAAWRGALLVSLGVAVAACPAIRSRTVPPEPLPAPAAVDEVRLPPPPRLEPRSPAGLAAARAVLALAPVAAGLSPWTEAADLILARVATEAAREGLPRVAAEALYLRGLLALRPDEPARLEAMALLEAASAMDPLGPFAAPAMLAVRLVESTGRQERELEGLRERLAASEQGRRREQGATETLRAEVESLKKQLDELKDVHLRIESEKKDGPS